ncbi:MAG TPA: hypothetical protein VKE96_26895 [Vicinamibacterales bacterium]|nr:hypothetical protein [Vicinamibacterales bacterium]
MALEILVALLLSGAGTPSTAVVPDRPFSIRIVDDQDLVPLAGRGRMRTEVNRIWSQYGVDVRWSTRVSRETPSEQMTVLLQGTREGWPLGRVERVGDLLRRQIVVSDGALRGLLDGVGVDRDNPLWVGLYARMFGRVVSHELGHLLLNSVAHSATGLMRTRFVISDVKATDDRFALTATEVERLRVMMMTSTTWAMNDRHH